MFCLFNVLLYPSEGLFVSGPSERLARHAIKLRIIQLVGFINKKFRHVLIIRL